MVEGLSKTGDGMLMGRLLGSITVIFPRVVADGRNGDHLIGELADIRIDRSTRLTLFGDLE
jgi:hypothetical protein